MRKLYISTSLIFILICFTSLFVFAQPPDFDDKKEFRDINDLREDISLANLINGLYLSESQMQQIVAIAKEAKALKEEYVTRHSETINQTKSAFSDLRSSVVNGDTIPPEVGRKAQMFNEKGKELMEGYTKQRVVLEEKVKSVLTQGQIQTIGDFKPCLLPPQKLSQPPRAGQASSSERAIKQLETIRKMPEQVYNKRKSAIIEKYFEGLEKHAGVHFENLTEKAQERQRISKLFDDIRKRSDLDFSLNKEKYAQEFSKHIIEKDEQIKQAQKLRKDFEGVGKIGRFMLNPRMSTILETKLTTGKSYSEQTLTNISKINPAENCDDGTCAINRKQ